MSNDSGTISGSNVSDVAVSCSDNVVITNHVSAGESHTCAIVDGTGLKCWGNGEFGRLGDNDLTAHSVTSPTAVAGLSEAVQVSAGNGYTCVVLSDGTIQCMGLNDNGELGDNSTTNSGVPVQVSGITTATQVVAGADHTCALLSSGSIQCWGDNTNGELGNASNTASLVPVAVSGITDAIDVAVGSNHSCAIDGVGAVLCWGDNTSGQLGDTTNTASNAPVTSSTASIAPAIDVTCGDAHTCAVFADGTIECWGEGDLGQLGDGGGADSNTPVAVTTSFSASSIGSTASTNATCARLDDATVECWGAGTLGSLGDGSGSDSGTPVVATGVTDAIDASGGNHSCSMLGDGNLQCWGHNAFGQVGDASTTQRDAPVSVTF